MKRVTSDWELLTYLPHKAVAEVSKHKEPIGRERAEFNWFESQLMSDSNELRVKWFGCHLVWDSNDFGCQLIWDSIDLVVNWFEIQMVWLSIDVCFKLFWLSVDLNFKWCGCQLIWDSSDSVVNWFEVQVIWLSTDVWFKRVCQTKLFCETSFKNEALKLQNEAFLRDFLQKWSFAAPKRSISARLPSKMKFWSSKNKVFLRDVLQKWSFEDQKRSISARLPSKMKLWSSKTKLLYETSFKNEALKIKNEAFLRDFLQKWHVDRTLGLRITIRISDFQLHASKVLRLPRKSWAEAYEVL